MWNVAREVRPNKTGEYLCASCWENQPTRYWVLDYSLEHDTFNTSNGKHLENAIEPTYWMEIEKVETREE